MIQLAQLTPTNLLAEKTKFFESDTYEPRFSYSQNIEPDLIQFYGQPKVKFFNQALKMTQQSFAAQLNPISPLATQTQVFQAVTEACDSLKIPILKVDFSHHYLSQLRLSRSTLYIRTPIQFTLIQLKGKIHHEIETHLLRLLNHTTLSLSPPEENYDFRSTEEGLASLHSYLDQPEVIMRKTFLSYIGCFLAQSLGFRATFTEMVKLRVSPELAWAITTRNKRGLVETEVPGGFTRDCTYLEGAVSVWQWLMSPDHQVKDLYLGRISLNQVIDTKKVLTDFSNPDQLRFPAFIANSAKYLATIAQIGQTNQFAQLVS